jgi:hypothetical protein
MINNDTLKWFIRGFMFTLLLFLVVVMVVRPNTGWAQGNGDEASSQEGGLQKGEPSTDLFTGDPEGRNIVTVSPDDPVESEQEGGIRDDDTAIILSTDDPAGRNMVPLPEDIYMEDEQERSIGDTGSTTGSGTDAPGNGCCTGDLEGATAPGGISAQAYGSPLVIPAADFTPRTTGELYNFLYEGGYTKGGYGCVMAPAYLPNGATVFWAYASVYDNDSAGGVRVYIRRVDNFDGTVEALSYMFTDVAEASAALQRLSDSSIDEPVVLYPNYSYYVLTCLDSDQTRLYSVRIYYHE